MTTLISVGVDGHEGNNGGFAGFVRSSLGLSGDGRYLAYDFPYPSAAPVVVSLPNELTNTAINTPTPSGALVGGRFTHPVRAVGISNVGAAAVLQVFDAADHLIAEAFTDGDGATADFLGVVSVMPIARFEYTYVSGGGFGGDDLVFETIMMADCTPLTLSLPAAITADAVSPAGVAVPFVVTATDDTDLKPVVICKPASGSLFPIGATMVGCTVTDSAGNSVNGSFTIVVRGALAQTKSLMDFVRGLQLPKIPEEILLATLQLALAAENRGQTRAACADLLAFRVEVAVDARLGLVSRPRAAALRQAVDQIRTVLGCH